MFLNVQLPSCFIFNIIDTMHLTQRVAINKTFAIFDYYYNVEQIITVVKRTIRKPGGGFHHYGKSKETKAVTCLSYKTKTNKQKKPKTKQPFVGKNNVKAGRSREDDTLEYQVAPARSHN